MGGSAWSTTTSGPDLRSGSHDCGDQSLTVGWRVGTLPLLDGDVIDGDVSLDTRASDPLDQHLTGIHISSG